MFVFRRPVRFAEVDAAGLVFFPRYHEYCHDALEAFFGELPGGYAALFRERDLGVPTVHLETDFKSPLRYGDVARFEMAIERVGRTSLTFHHTIRRESDAIVAATVRHVVVMTRISTLTPIPVPDDIRELLDGDTAEAQRRGAGGLRGASACESRRHGPRAGLVPSAGPWPRGYFLTGCEKPDHRGVDETAEVRALVVVATLAGGCAGHLLDAGPHGGVSGVQAAGPMTGLALHVGVAGRAELRARSARADPVTWQRMHSPPSFSSFERRSMVRACLVCDQDVKMAWWHDLQASAPTYAGAAAGAWALAMVGSEPGEQTDEDDDRWRGSHADDPPGGAMTPRPLHQVSPSNE